MIINRSFKEFKLQHRSKKNQIIYSSKKVENDEVVKEFVKIKKPLKDEKAKQVSEYEKQDIDAVIFFEKPQVKFNRKMENNLRVFTNYSLAHALCSFGLSPVKASNNNNAAPIQIAQSAILNTGKCESL